jgi:dolichol-phosphate mannosyltransferase
MLISIIIPCYNEHDYLPVLLEKIEKVDLGGHKKQIIIADDGSTDGTPEVIKKRFPQFSLVLSDRNYGKAHAIREGLKLASGEVVLIQDADLEYDPDDYPALIGPFVTHGAKVVYGSRILGRNNGKSSELYYFGGKFISLVANILYGSTITDETTGYKLFDNNLLKSLNIASQGFEFCSEVTGKILRRGITIHEVPIKYCPRSRKEGKKVRAVKDGFKAVWTLVKIRFLKQYGK